MQTFELTADQQAAAHAFAMFMASDETEFTISGGAGVGKTTLLRHLRDCRDSIVIAQLLGRPHISDWYFTATTNKAAEVLSQAIGTETTTIHALLGLTVSNDYATGAVKVTRRSGSKVIENAVIVIDECSMIDSTLQKYINAGTFNCKIIYVGDHCQLAPVAEPISPVFVNTVPQYINQIVRSQHTPEITALCQHLRQTVESETLPIIQEIPGVIDYLSAEQAEEKIDQYFVEPEHCDNARILCYTNKMVVGLNSWIRHKKGFPETFAPGDEVVSNQATHMVNQKTMVRIEENLVIEEVSDEYTYTVASKEGIIYSIPSYDLLVSGRERGWIRLAKDPGTLRAITNALYKTSDWGAYFQVKEGFGDLRPRFASTVYKAQGSTYHTVFVHLADIGKCTQLSQALRMLYVACSRATHRIYLIGALPRRLTGD